MGTLVVDKEAYRLGRRRAQSRRDFKAYKSIVSQDLKLKPRSLHRPSSEGFVETLNICRNFEQTTVRIIYPFIVFILVLEVLSVCSGLTTGVSRRLSQRLK